MRKYVFHALLLLTAAGGFSLEEDLHIKIMRTTEPSAPHLYNGYIFFTYKPTKPVRYVGISFAHEQFREVHLFQRNDRGILFFSYPAPAGVGYVDYRLVIDGIWTFDPLNPTTYQDAQGISISRFEFPRTGKETKIQSPILHSAEGKIEFNFQTSPGKAVYVTGSFNRWDPFLYRMQEVRPGLYSLSIRLLPGNYTYAFYMDGKRFPDPLNGKKGWNPDGQEASLLYIPGS
jgi:hypothetical protein